MASKYADVLKKLDRLPVQDQSHQDRIDEIKQEILQTTPSQGTALATLYGQLRRLVDERETELKVIKHRLEAVSQLLVNQYEVESVTNVTLGNGDKVRVQEEPYAVVENREQFRQWCIANGFETSLMLPWQTTNATTKAYLLDGRPEPEGVKAYFRSKIVFQSGE